MLAVALFSSKFEEPFFIILSLNLFCICRKVLRDILEGLLLLMGVAFRREMGGGGGGIEGGGGGGGGGGTREL